MKPIVIIIFLTILSGCTVGLHGSFIEKSYHPLHQERQGVLLGKVHGTSCQQNVLYLFPKGEKIGTDKAISDAMAQHESTDYLANISIDNTRHFGVGYSVTCMEVEAEAYSLQER
jgi:hypothetical protein